MSWTKGLPEQPGYYWAIIGAFAKPELVSVRFEQGKIKVYRIQQRWAMTKFCLEMTKWWFRIEPPPEPEGKA